MKTVMPNRKAFLLLFILQLSVANFSVAALHDACLCGEACRHGLGEKAETGDHGTHHDRCSDPGCESCNVERMLNLDASPLYDTSHRVRSHEAPCAVAFSPEDLFNDQTLEHFHPVYSGGGIDHPAIYLRNASLLF